METLLLSRSEVQSLLEPRQLLEALREAFITYASHRTVDAMRVPVPLPPSESPAGASGMLLAPGLVPGVPAYTVKVHAKFPSQEPAIRGVLVLHDLSTGEPLAIMDSGYLTALRTGLAGALGADALARPDASKVAIIGAGAQGQSQLQALRLVRTISHVRVFDTSVSAAESFASAPACNGLTVSVAGSVEAAVSGTDIVVTATWARSPFLFSRHIAPGMHITTLGPDQPGKCEVGPDVLQSAIVVVDDRKLAMAMGAVGGAGLGSESIHAELGEVLAGARPGRTQRDDVTVFGSVGLAFQDLAAGWLAFTLAKRNGFGRYIDLLA